jgi:ubiquinone biosynthesis protein
MAGLQGRSRAITALGPAYVKFGQILSTRPDVVGVELANQLTMLQDRLPPFPTETAITTIESALGDPVGVLFSEFSDPVAAASIAQVHRARRADNGREVAVKVLRPGIEGAFRRDIDAFHFAASMIERLSPATRRLRPRDVISHFESVVTGELDLRLEAASASEFAENTAGDAGMEVPKPHWHLSARRVLSTDWAEGVPMGDVAALRAAGHDLPQLGANVLQLFLRHALRDGYFHADMHQGNLKVAADGDIIIYDFGIMGEIDEYTRRVYAEILMGFIQRDYERVARVHFEAGYVPRDRDMLEFARALRAVGEPHLDGESSRLSLRGDRALRHGHPDRADPAATHHGRGRGGGALAGSTNQHVGGRPPRRRKLYPRQSGAARGGARHDAHRPADGPIRAAFAGFSGPAHARAVARPTGDPR